MLLPVDPVDRKVSKQIKQWDLPAPTYDPAGVSPQLLNLARGREFSALAAIFAELHVNQEMPMEEIVEFFSSNPHPQIRDRYTASLCLFTRMWTELSPQDLQHVLACARLDRISAWYQRQPHEFVAGHHDYKAALYRKLQRFGCDEATISAFGAMFVDQLPYEQLAQRFSNPRRVDLHGKLHSATTHARKLLQSLNPLDLPIDALWTSVRG